MYTMMGQCEDETVKVGREDFQSNGKAVGYLYQSSITPRKRRVPLSPVALFSNSRRRRQRLLDHLAVATGFRRVREKICQQSMKRQS